MGGGGGGVIYKRNEWIRQQKLRLLECKSRKVCSLQTCFKAIILTWTTNNNNVWIMCTVIISYYVYSTVDNEEFKYCKLSLDVNHVIIMILLNTTLSFPHDSNFN